MAEYPAIHAPTRPDWTCTACGDEWPCRTRKRQLTELFQDNTVGLINYLTPYLADANMDLRELTTVKLAKRFLGWCAKPLPEGRTSDPADL